MYKYIFDILLDSDTEQEEEEEVISPEGNLGSKILEMNMMVDDAFFQSLVFISKSKDASKTLPIPADLFYTNYMKKNVPINTNIDIKKSSHKKVNIIILIL